MKVQHLDEATTDHIDPYQLKNICIFVSNLIHFMNEHLHSFIRF